MEAKDFTRERLLPFWRVIVLLFSGWKSSVQNRLNKFFDKLGILEEVPTGSALCQARSKIDPAFFKYLNEVTVKFFYEKYEPQNLVKKWKGKYLYAVDCSRLNLPDSEEIRSKYSIQTNQNDEKGVCQGLSSFLYDVLNEVTINAELDKNKAEKLFIFEQHKNYYEDDVVTLYDRAYADYSVIAYHIKFGKDFIIRCNLVNTFKSVEKFIKSNNKDGIVNLKVTKKQEEFVKKADLPLEVNIRAVKVKLSNGTEELLLTSLLNGEVYKPEDFKEAYNKRWGVETYFDRLKNQLEVERFSSNKENSFLQDFYGMVFLSTLESVISKEEEEEIKKSCRKKGRKYEYRINKSVSYTAILDNVVEIFLKDDISSSKVVDKLRFIFKTGLSPQRPERKVKRKKVSDAKKLRFYKYNKKSIV